MHDSITQTNLEKPVDFESTCCSPYDSAVLVNQLDGGKLRSVLHCRRAKFEGTCTAEYFTTALDFT